MPDEEIIPVEMICSHYQVELTFLDTLESFGLISFRYKNDHKYVQQEEMAELEKYARLHYDLDLNAEGIDVLRHLLEKIKTLQQEAELLRSRLKLYEEG